jgi:cyclopropane fatty-acyl-phospholipid synthase-like methyltransferase
VTDPSGYGSRTRLTFHGPLSGERADRLASDLAAVRPADVIDYGCGWGELLLRVLEAAPGAHGVGIDTHGQEIARGRANADKRGLSGRVSFIEGPATDHARPADAVISNGSYQAFGTVHEASRPCGRW